MIQRPRNTLSYICNDLLQDTLESFPRDAIDTSILPESMDYR